MQNTDITNAGFIKLFQFIGRAAVTPEEAAANKISGKGPKRPRHAIDGLHPMGRSTFYLGLKLGKFPKPVRSLGDRAVFLRMADVRAFLSRVGEEAR